MIWTFYWLIIFIQTYNFPQSFIQIKHWGNLVINQFENWCYGNMLNNNASIAFESKITFKTKCNEEAIYFLKKDFSRKVFIIKDNVHKKERRILWNGNCREKRHSVVKIIIKHICQRLLTFKLLLRDDSKRLSKPNRLPLYNSTYFNLKTALRFK